MFIKSITLLIVTTSGIAMSQSVPGPDEVFEALFHFGASDFFSNRNVKSSAGWRVHGNSPLVPGDLQFKNNVNSFFPFAQQVSEECGKFKLNDLTIKMRNKFREMYVYNGKQFWWERNSSWLRPQLESYVEESYGYRPLDITIRDTLKARINVDGASIEGYLQTGTMTFNNYAIQETGPCRFKVSKGTVVVPWKLKWYGSPDNWTAVSFGGLSTVLGQDPE